MNRWLKGVAVASVLWAMILSTIILDQYYREKKDAYRDLLYGLTPLVVIWGVIWICRRPASVPPPLPPSHE